MSPSRSLLWAMRCDSDDGKVGRGAVGEVLSLEGADRQSLQGSIKVRWRTPTAVGEVRRLKRLL